MTDVFGVGDFESALAPGVDRYRKETEQDPEHHHLNGRNQFSRKLHENEVAAADDSEEPEENDGQVLQDNDS